MLSEDDSNQTPLKEACYPLLSIAVGLLSCSVLAALSYFTYEATAGNMSYCTLWTDIPGRLAIFLSFYYAAGVCGTLPIPDRFRMECLPQPFILYKLESWKHLYRNLRRFLTFNRQTYPVFEGDDPEISPMRKGSNESASDCSPNSQEPSPNIPITKTDTPKTHIDLSNKRARDRDVEIADNSVEFSMSFDSPRGGHIVPMVKGRSSKPRYFTDSSISTTETSGKSIPVNAASEDLYEISGNLNDLAKALVEIRDERVTPPRTPDVKLPLPSYPRFPWSFLKHRNGIPQEAKALHKRHLKSERRELDRECKRQRMEENVQLPKDKDSDKEWVTDSDEFNLFVVRPLCPPLIPS